MGGIVSSNRGVYGDYTIIEVHKDLMMTPPESAQEIIDWCMTFIGEHDTVLEPFKGKGALYDLISNEKFYCEIDEGIDFFTYTKRVDWVISNPPFRVLHKGEAINAFIKIINATMGLCDKGFFYLVNHKLWSSLTVKRLKEWERDGWVISAIKVMEIKKWYGRYYVVMFQKGGKGILSFGSIESDGGKEWL